MDLSVITAALISGGVVSSLVAWWANKDNVTASTYQQLVISLATMNKTLDEVNAQQEADKIQFERKIRHLRDEQDQKLAEQKSSYEKRMTDMAVMHNYQMAKLNLRIDELEIERNELLIENRELRKRKGDQNDPE